MLNGNADGRLARSEAKAVASPGALAVDVGVQFVLTPEVERLASRALAYLRAGYPVHFWGPAGSGKTTLALHVAALRGRAVTLMHGDDELGSSHLVGADSGYRRRTTVDNYVRSVIRTEETMNTLWAESRLTVACRNGDTLVYDEFTRSRPEANNVLLSVLEERLLTLPRRTGRGECHVEVDPEFRAIFTSNPEEYAGVHRTQDALLDRLIGIHVDYYDRDTEICIAAARSGMEAADAAAIVDIVRELRRLGVNKQGPSLRAGIMIARLARQQGAEVRQDDLTFRGICRDVLAGALPKVVRDGVNELGCVVDAAITRHLRAATGPASTRSRDSDDDAGSPTSRGREQ